MLTQASEKLVRELVSRITSEVISGSRGKTAVFLIHVSTSCYDGEWHTAAVRVLLVCALLTDTACAFCCRFLERNLLDWATSLNKQAFKGATIVDLMVCENTYRKQNGADCCNGCSNPPACPSQATDTSQWLQVQRFMRGRFTDLLRLLPVSVPWHMSAVTVRQPQFHFGQDMQEFCGLALCEKATELNASGTYAGPWSVRPELH